MFLQNYSFLSLVEVLLCVIFKTYFQLDICWSIFWYTHNSTGCITQRVCMRQFTPPNIHYNLIVFVVMYVCNISGTMWKFRYISRSVAIKAFQTFNNKKTAFPFNFKTIYSQFSTAKLSFYKTLLVENE